MKKNNIFKIVISVMLAAMLCFGACGCGNSTTNAAAAKETAKTAKEDSVTKETTTASKDKKTTTSKSEKETTTQASKDKTSKDKTSSSKQETTKASENATTASAAAQNTSSSSSSSAQAATNAQKSASSTTSASSNKSSAPNTTSSTKRTEADYVDPDPVVNISDPNYCAHHWNLEPDYQYVVDKPAYTETVAEEVPIEEVFYCCNKCNFKTQSADEISNHCVFERASSCLSSFVVGYKTVYEEVYHEEEGHEQALNKGTQTCIKCGKTERYDWTD